MTLKIEPLLQPVAIEALRPTQMTVGYREVARKRRLWRERVERDGPAWLGGHMIPAVIGPKHRAWIIDHHHLARALHDEGVKHVLIRVVADLSHVKEPLFMTYLDNRNWLHPYDKEGHRQDTDAVPRHIGKLDDDPYRSLAGELRRGAAMPRPARRSRNSCGPISCATASRFPRSRTISRARCKRR